MNLFRLALRAAAASGLAATGLAAGALVLAPAPAQAAAACGNAPVSFATVFTPGFACQLGNAVLDSFVTAFTPPATSTASVSFAFLGDVYDIDLSFNPADTFVPSATFGYRFDLLDPAESVVGAALDVNGNGVRPIPGQTQPGEYAGVARILNPSLVQVLELTSIDGVRDPAGVSFTGMAPLNTIVVAQGVTTSPQQPGGARPSINNVSNQFITERRVQVPGPLPIFGVLSAFGFSRKLRQRIEEAA